jgi:hypothetical protein
MILPVIKWVTREGRVYEIEGARLLRSRGSWPNRVLGVLSGGWEVP